MRFSYCYIPNGDRFIFLLHLLIYCSKSTPKILIQLHITVD